MNMPQAVTKQYEAPTISRLGTFTDITLKDKYEIGSGVGSKQFD